MFVCLLPVGAAAATLGKLTVLSAIGQPLNAEIELLSVSEQEKQAMSVKLAPPQAFSKANVEFNPALAALQFAIETRGKAQIVHVTSAGAFNEPFVDVLLELSGTGMSRAVREYSFLLEPPHGSQEKAAPQVAPAAAAAQPAAKPEPGPGPESKTGAGAPKAARNAAGKSEYKVKQGDSLSEIANRMRPPGVSLDQMLVAMYRANPDAFVGENMSRMRAGKVLKVPDAATASALARPEATSIVVAQARDFNVYRNQLAARIAQGPAKPAGAAAQAAGGKIAAKVEERTTPAGAARDKLQLSKAGGSDAASGGMTSEDKIAADKAAAEAESRIKDLEKNVADLQKLLEIKNQNLAALSAQKAPAAADAAPAATPASAATPAAAPAATPAAAATATAAAPPPASSPTPKPVLAAPEPKPDFLEGWRENPMLLPGGGMLAALLIAWGLYRARRKPDAAKPDIEKQNIGMPSAPAAAVPEPAVQQPVAATAMAPTAAAAMAMAPAAADATPAVAPDAELRTAMAEQATETPIVASDDPLFATDEAAVHAAAQAEAAQRRAERDAEDALKIDLGRLDPPAAPPATPAALDMSKVDFDLELDHSLHPPAAGDEGASGIDLAAELAAAQEQQALRAAQAAAAKDAAVSEAETPPQAAVAPAPVPDKPAILPPAVEALSLDLSDPVPAEEVDDELSSFSKEINTKLDLAAAYQEIGDKDGARELLDEVAKAGNKRQVAKAQDMLAQLA